MYHLTAPAPASRPQLGPYPRSRHAACTLPSTRGPRTRRRTAGPCRRRARQGANLPPVPHRGPPRARCAVEPAGRAPAGARCHTGAPPARSRRSRHPRARAPAGRGRHNSPPAPPCRARRAKTQHRPRAGPPRPWGGGLGGAGRDPHSTRCGARRGGAAARGAARAQWPPPVPPPRTLPAPARFSGPLRPQNQPQPVLPCARSAGTMPRWLLLLALVGAAQASRAGSGVSNDMCGTCKEAIRVMKDLMCDPVLEGDVVRRGAGRLAVGAPYGAPTGRPGRAARRGGRAPGPDPAPHPARPQTGWVIDNLCPETGDKKSVRADDGGLGPRRCAAAPGRRPERGGRALLLRPAAPRPLPPRPRADPSTPTPSTHPLTSAPTSSTASRPRCSTGCAWAPTLRRCARRSASAARRCRRSSRPPRCAPAPALALGWGPVLRLQPTASQQLRRPARLRPLTPPPHTAHTRVPLPPRPARPTPPSPRRAARATPMT
jgi:hypothetical protein